MSVQESKFDPVIVKMTHEILKLGGTPEMCDFDFLGDLFIGEIIITNK